MADGIVLCSSGRRCCDLLVPSKPAKISKEDKVATRALMSTRNMKPFKTKEVVADNTRAPTSNWNTKLVKSSKGDMVASYQGSNISPKHKASQGQRGGGRQHQSLQLQLERDTGVPISNWNAKPAKTSKEDKGSYLVSMPIPRDLPQQHPT